MGKGMPQEMLALRDALTRMGIDWHDASDKRDLFGWSESDVFGGGYTRIWRTHWETSRRRYSAICGFATYGAHSDLLELRIDNDEPRGWLTAQDVIDRMEV